MISTSQFCAHHLADQFEVWQPVAACAEQTFIAQEFWQDVKSGVPSILQSHLPYLCK